MFKFLKEQVDEGTSDEIPEETSPGTLGRTFDESFAAILDETVERISRTTPEEICMQLSRKDFWS